MGHGFRGLVACNRRIGTSERVRESFSLGAFPSLARRGGCGINKKSQSHRSAADGVVAHTQMFQKCIPKRHSASDHPVRAFNEKKPSALPTPMSSPDRGPAGSLQGKVAVL